MGKARLVSELKDLDMVKSAKKDEINLACSQSVVGGFQSTVVLANTGTAHFYGTDERDQINFMGKLTVLNANPEITTVLFKAKDVGDFVIHTRDEFIQVCTEAVTFIEGKIHISVQKKKAIDEAASVEEVNVIIW